MSIQGAHILTGNVVPVTGDYLVTEVMPVFEKVQRTQALEERYFVIAGRNIKMCFFGNVGALSLVRALAHLEVATLSTVDLTVHFFDEVHADATIAAPWNHSSYISEGDESSSSDFLGAYIRGEDTLTLYDRATATAYFWSHDFSALPRWVIAAPLRTLLHWVLAEQDIHMVHGAALGNGKRAVLLTARGGSGKSTTALASLLRGVQYLADDYVGIARRDTIGLHSLYSSVKVSPAYADSIPALKEHVWNAEGEKTILFLNEHFPDCVGGNLPLSAILIPTIANKEKTTFVPASTAHALFAIAPTTLFQLPLTRTDKIEALRDIIRRTPRYRMELSSDPTEVARAVERFLEQGL